ncbi:hypothetical protein U1Q18_027695, partial [Sarracenia purpurea var. burkii]
YITSSSLEASLRLVISLQSDFQKGEDKRKRVLDARVLGIDETSKICESTGIKVVFGIFLQYHYVEGLKP